MIRYTQGNLLESDAEALANTVNTVGVMGKGIALMFKETFPENFRLYSEACKRGEVVVGRMFVTERNRLGGPRLIINFPTKENWRNPSKIEWIEEGLLDLKRVIADRLIRSIAIPPLGSGQGGLEWSAVRSRIAETLGALEGVDVMVYEPTPQYQNVSKRSGVAKLTPARALIADLVRRYEVLGFECSLLEIQKLAWFLERSIMRQGLPNLLKLEFAADRYGPYADKLRHLLNGLDGSYLHCDKRINDAKPSDIVRFDDSKADVVKTFLTTAEAKPYRDALERTDELIDGFQSPLGMELLATVDWLLHRLRVEPAVGALRAALSSWPGGRGAGERKARLFDDRMLGLALARLLPIQ
ncbi:MAG TPA: macro domain-containing protein [Rhizomicrobium sp.]|jgi:O-acetyl-ADP-ribose deacetylase (regulator of RNase III)|nr:macro domain-containing protein [Rhizomicrobium sp.]